MVANKKVTQRGSDVVGNARIETEKDPESSVLSNFKANAHLGYLITFLHWFEFALFF